MRQRLVTAALKIYRKEGLDAVSFRRLADAVGLSHTLPYRYFEHKEALLVAMRVVCTQRFESFVRAREAVDAPLLSRINSVATAYVEFVRLNPDEYQLIFTMNQPPPDQYPELLAARRSFFEHAVDIVGQSIATGQLQGDPRELTHALWIGLHGLMGLHVANQLVHGRNLEQLVQPLLSRILGQSTPSEKAIKPARAARRKSNE